MRLKRVELKQQLHLRSLQAYVDTACEAALVEIMGKSRQPASRHDVQRQSSGLRVII